MMELPGFSRLRPSHWGVAAATLLAAALGWQVGQPPTTAAPITTPANWALPTLAGRDPGPDAAILAARHPWGGRAGFRDVDAPAPAPGSSWRLAGIVERGDERLALVLIGPGPTGRLEYRAVGDALPDGSVLVQIDADSATSEGGQSEAAGRRVYRLFDKAR